MHRTNISIWSAEFLGTFWLTLGGCGSAVLAAAFPGLGIGLLGVSLAFGLTVVTGAYAFGPVSGAHFNPAVSFGLVVAGRPGADIGNFAVNGYGIHSPGQYGLVAALVCEVVMTAMFLIVILGATAKPAAPGFAGLAIGLCLTLIHLVSIPVTNTSVNPARSIGPALFGPAWASSQLWLFVVAPLAGAAIGALVHRFLLKSSDEADAG